jgi:hypothetical protein
MPLKSFTSSFGQHQASAPNSHRSFGGSDLSAIPEVSSASTEISDLLEIIHSIYVIQASCEYSMCGPFNVSVSPLPRGQNQTKSRLSTLDEGFSIFCDIEDDHPPTVGNTKVGNNSKVSSLSNVFVEIIVYH